LKTTRISTTPVSLQTPIETNKNLEHLEIKELERIYKELLIQKKKLMKEKSLALTKIPAISGSQSKQGK
jgi:hypothetical protein